ncbi:MAG: acetyl-coenzyme A synthetase N-terminal domain-containing protein, partial [Vicinamibacterales bacterium]
MTAQTRDSGSRYHAVYDSWKRDPEGFWKTAAAGISWYKLWDKVYDPYAGQY